MFTYTTIIAMLYKEQYPQHYIVFRLKRNDEGITDAVVCSFVVHQ